MLVDLKKFSTNLDWDEPPYLLKISGPGGTAKFPVPPDFDLSLTRWNTFLAFITESEWQMINGDWESLMDDVSEVRLALDFYDSDSSIGMDNFRINNEPPTAYFTADQTEIWLGDEITFTDYSTNSPDSWFWDFGDETTGILPNPHHTYTETGIYDVTLSAENIFGADSLTRTSNITVVDPVPQELPISVSADSVYLVWNSVAGTDLYKINGAEDPTSEFDSLAVSADSTWSSHISGIDKKFFSVSAVK